MKIRTQALFVVAAAMSAMVACSKDDDDNNNNMPPDNNPPKATINIASNAQLGQIITDSLGNTLYFYSMDSKPDTSYCSGGCLAVWPAFYSANLTLGDSRLHAEDFGTITRADGAKQTTYKGWPLYYYASDAAAGDVKGEAFNNVWFVAKPDYSVMLVNKQLVGNDGVEYNSTYTPGKAITQFLTDDYGRTLYAFSPDKFKKNTYTDSLFTKNPTWPVYEISAVNSVPSILAKTDFDTVHVFSHVQLAYKGWPLYFFGPDAMTRGNTKGVSVPKPGVWPIVNLASAAAPQP
jgi:predicted lipoprotein with Yx(FWY)xxD motif